MAKTLQDFKTSLKRNVLTLSVCYLVMVFCLLFIVFYVFNLKTAELSLEQIKADNKLFQASISEKIGVIASSPIFINYMRSGDQTRQEDLLDFESLLSTMQAPVISGMKIQDAQGGEIFSSGQSTKYYSVLKLCYLNSTLNSGLGACNYSWTLYFDQNKYMQSLKEDNNLIEECKSCQASDLLGGASFGSFPVITHGPLLQKITLSTSSNNIITEVFIFLIVLFLALVLMLSQRHIIESLVRKFVVAPISLLTKKIKSGQELTTTTEEILEIQYLKEQIALFESKSKMIELGEISAQVAHDIRSPLSALDTLLNNLHHQIPEQERIMMRTAFRRINNIANDLVAKYKGKEYHPDTPVFLYVVIKDIVSEKDLEYDAKHVKFELTLDEPQSAFLLVEGNYKEMRRMFSNLINNAVNAMPEGGVIQMGVRCVEHRAEITIQDQGCGISATRIKQLLSGEGAKKAGIGLGLHHAKDYMKAHGGELSIQSKEQVGSTVAMIFKVFPQPQWLAKELIVDTHLVIAIIDDDASIHDIWIKKFEHLKIKRMDFYRTEDCRTWLDQGNRPGLILCDYEFVGQEETGLEFLKSIYHLGLSGYLVTTHVDNEAILADCESFNLQLIPKHLLPYVLVHEAEGGNRRKKNLATMLSMIHNNGQNIVGESEGEPALVLIDNEPYNHEYWRYAAKRRGKKIMCFTSLKAFMDDEGVVDKKIPIYVDLNLGAESGINISKQLYDLGYQKVYITTGFINFDIKQYPWLSGVIDKTPPFN